MNNAAFKKVVLGYFELHKLEMQGLGDSTQAETIRDSLDKPWHQLNDYEVCVANLISSELNKLIKD